MSKSNKKVKQMICDCVVNRFKGNCGTVMWEHTHGFGDGYPNSVLIIDGANDVEYAFWYAPHPVSLTANQLRGV